MMSRFSLARVLVLVRDDLEKQRERQPPGFVASNSDLNVTITSGL